MATHAEITIDSTTMRGTLLDISIGGLLLDAEIRMEDGQNAENLITENANISVDIPLLKLRGLHGVVARVADIGISSTVAVKFHDVTPEVAHRLIERIAKK